MLKISKIEYDNKNSYSFFKSLIWENGYLIDKISNVRYYPDGSLERTNSMAIGYKFDSVKITNDYEYYVVFEKFGTKGLLFKGMNFLREINRPYQHADLYEYPIEIFKLACGTPVIAHCPKSYYRLDFENIETGEIITDKVNRNPNDFFHSRLMVNKSAKFLLNAGWYWHPWDCILIYSIDEVIQDPSLLDMWGIPIISRIYTEINSARFFNDNYILMSSSDESPYDQLGIEDNTDDFPRNCIGLLDLETLTIVKKSIVNCKFGNVFPIDMDFAWDLYLHPKIINLNTGEIVDEITDIYSGEQCSSILTTNNDTLPHITQDINNHRIAIGKGNKINIVSWIND